MSIVMSNEKSEDSRPKESLKDLKAYDPRLRNMRLMIRDLRAYGFSVEEVKEMLEIDQRTYSGYSRLRH
jgi:DNA-binding transcriptional MerR regulator